MKDRRTKEQYYKEQYSKEQYSKEWYRKDNTFTIDVAKDFSILPSGRVHTSDGRHTSEAMFMLIADALEYNKYVEIKFNNLLQVGSSFLDHLAQMIVINHCSEYVTITSDCEWTTARWNKYLNNYKDKYNSGEL